MAILQNSQPDSPQTTPYLSSAGAWALALGCMIGWIVDIVTIGATVVYAYISICNMIVGVREKRRAPVIGRILGAIIAVSFIIFYLIPSFHITTDLASRSC